MKLNRTDVKPWTWKQIAALNGKKYFDFLERYGDRGKLAMVIAESIHDHKYSVYDRDSCNWGCGECPVWNWKEYNGPRRLFESCLDLAIELYRKLIAEHGRLP